MPDSSDPSTILVDAAALAATQLCGTLATMHAEHGTPYVTFVLFHLMPDGTVLFGSGESPQHSRNIDATPEVSFLIDNREAIHGDWNTFDRVVIEGQAEKILRDDDRYSAYLEAMRAKDATTATFTERASLYCIHPRRLVMRKGLQPDRLVVDFDELD
jgi:nitroimidazol reductase NimA-like FMN-containing flavoprotein (pyridoxamine 5'-phosphate oxidase superfamily)